MENVVDITSLVDFFKFGYTGDVINLIYLFLIMRFFIFPILLLIFNKIKGVIEK